MEPILIILCVVVGGLLASLGAHLLPVGGAPAAMGTATGIATGTVQIMLGAAMTGLFTAASAATFTDSLLLVALSGAIGATVMICVVMLMANILYTFGCGIVPVSGRVDVDPLTKEPQAPYKTPQTDGHGVPNCVYVSGMLGGFVGGFGGALMYFALLNYADFTAGTAAIGALSIFVPNAIIAAYNIRGTIEGFHDPKFKRLPFAMVTSLVVSLLCGILVVIASYLTVGGTM